MSASTVNQHVPGSLPGQADLRGLRRITGLAGLATLLLVFIPGIAGSAQEPGFTGTSEQIGAFFSSIDTTMGSIGSFASTLGVIAFLWFALGLSTLLRGAESQPPWRSNLAAGSAVVFVAVALGGSWTAATLRAASLDPGVGRFAFDLGNASFANGWVALGSFAICSGAAIISTGVMPRWLGWWATIAGAGLVLSRAVWTSEIWLLPYAAFWLWVIVVCVTLLRPTAAPEPHS
jgi:hypothetical protein